MKTPEQIATDVCTSSGKEWVLEEACEYAIAAFTQCPDLETLSSFKARFDVALRSQTTHARSSLYHFAFELCTSDQCNRLLYHLHEMYIIHSESRDPKTLSVSTVILSDIDDTLHAFYKDRRFPRGTVYPGVTQFFVELSSEWLSDSDHYRIPGRLETMLSFVTARPGWMRGVTENMLARSGFEDEILLMGTTTGLVTSSSMIAKKYEHCKRMRCLYPECQLVFVGDNGQADIDMGKRILEDGIVNAVFIHDIFASQHGVSSLLAQRHQTPMQGDQQEAPEARLNIRRHLSTPVSSEASLWEQNRLAKLDEERSFFLRYRGIECLESGIVLFQNYAGAAIAAHRRAMLTSDGVTRVILASAAECRAKYHRAVKDGVLQQTARWMRHLPERDALELHSAVHQLLNVEPEAWAPQAR